MADGARVTVVGAGPAGLAAAEVAAQAGARVTVLDHMPSPARKFLMAGRGGLNLTNAEDFEPFLNRYGAAAPALRAALAAFPPDALRDWADRLGADTFVGTSGRVFPRAMKASPLLRAWLARLDGLGVRLVTRARWTGWDGARLRVEGAAAPAADAVILACGGASWPRLGSDGGWAGVIGGPVAPMVPANCGFVVAWSPGFAERFAGTPLKGAAYAFDGPALPGEAVITAGGIEGGAVYALSAALRDAIARDGAATLTLDLRPGATAAALAAKLAAQRPGLSLANRLRRLGLSPLAAALLREAGAPPREPEGLAARLKALPLRLTATAGLARAISTAGGVPFAALDARLMLRERPGVFAAGEMLDWEAPTGGYLLQACMATGRWAGMGAIGWVSP